MRFFMRVWFGIYISTFPLIFPFLIQLTLISYTSNRMTMILIVFKTISLTIIIVQVMNQSFYRGRLCRAPPVAEWANIDEKSTAVWAAATSR